MMQNPDTDLDQNLNPSPGALRFVGETIIHDSEQGIGTSRKVLQQYQYSKILERYMWFEVYFDPCGGIEEDPRDGQ